MAPCERKAPHPSHSTSSIETIEGHYAGESAREGHIDYLESPTRRTAAHLGVRKEKSTDQPFLPVRLSS